MQKLSLKKQLSIIRLYLSGFSYQEISARVGVSKGTVANIVADLRGGRILDVEGPADQLELLRELGTDLRRLKLPPSQAVVGLAALSHLQDLRIEPAEIGRWVEVYRDLAASESDRQAFLTAALYMAELRQSTGLSFGELEAKAQSLEEEVARLEPLARELRKCQKQLPKLTKQQQSLSRDISQLEKLHDRLLKSVAQNEKREAELSRRIQSMEQRAQDADEKLAAARKDLNELAALGLSLDELPGFVHRISAVAQRHGTNSRALRDKLLQGLEALDGLMGLEPCLKRKHKELKDIEHQILKASQQYKSEDRALKRLRQQHANLRAAIAQEQYHLGEEMRAYANIATEATAKLRRDLQKSIGESLLEIDCLRDQAFELGQEVGRCNAIVEANQWLQTMVTLVKGDGDISSQNVRAVVLAVLRGFKSWTQQDQGQFSQSDWLTTQVGSLIEELERWRD